MKFMLLAVFAAVACVTSGLEVESRTDIVGKTAIVETITPKETTGDAPIFYHPYTYPYFAHQYGIGLPTPARFVHPYYNPYYVDGRIIDPYFYHGLIPAARKIKEITPVE